MRIDVIETDRMLIRGFTKDDALWAYKIWNDPEMGKYLPDEAKPEIDYEYLKELETLGDDEECCYLIPVLKDTSERVDTCSFMMSEDGKTYDIAYCVHQKLWNKGYATEIATGLIAYARKQGAKKVTIYVAQDNIASNQVAKKCGGKIAGEKTYKKRGTDEWKTEYLYEVTL